MVGIIDQIKQLITTKRPATRADAESKDGSATAAAERLWHEHQHETAPVSHSDAELPDKREGKPEQR
jgi:hypothetical protein